MTQLPFEDLPRQADKSATSYFADFWAAYPRHVGKRKAELAFSKALARAAPDVIMAGLERYKRNKPAYCDWMHPTTFLNGDHWEDECDSPVKLRPHDPDPDALRIISAHAKQPWCERGKYTRDVLQRCVDAGLLTVERMEEVL